MRPASRLSRLSTGGGVTIRTAEVRDIRRLYELIRANLEEGHLLPRTLPELRSHVSRFVVAVKGRRIVACAELAPLSPMVAEVRSLAVDATARGGHLGMMIVDELRRRARREGFDKLCAFTHAPGYFIRMNFSIVPHTWLLEKVVTDCMKCPLFHRCGQFAMVVPLDSPLDSAYPVPAAAATPV
jgi:amino-acid N-acetyltransferase